MAVTKLPRTRRRRPHLGLLRQATHNRQQQRLSNTRASLKRHGSNSVKSPAPRASGYPRYNAHKHARFATRTLGKPSKPGMSAPRATQPRKKSKLSSSSLADEKENAKPLKDNYIIPTRDIDWDAYDRAKAHRLKKIRIWVHHLRRSHRIVDSVAKELMAYYGSKKYGNHPSASTLSEHAWQAVKLCEHEFGTDLQWGKSLGEAVWGGEHQKVEALFEMKMAGGEGTPGRGTVGESDLSEFEDEEESGKWEEEDEVAKDDDDDEAFWGDEKERDVEMADTA